MNPRSHPKALLTVAITRHHGGGGIAAGRGGADDGHDQDCYQVDRGEQDHRSTCSWKK